MYPMKRNDVPIVSIKTELTESNNNIIFIHPRNKIFPIIIIRKF